MILPQFQTQPHIKHNNIVGCTSWYPHCYPYQMLAFYHPMVGWLPHHRCFTPFAPAQSLEAPCPLRPGNGFLPGEFGDGCLKISSICNTYVTDMVGMIQLDVLNLPASGLQDYIYGGSLKKRMLRMRFFWGTGPPGGIHMTAEERPCDHAPLSEAPRHRASNGFDSGNPRCPHPVCCQDLGAGHFILGHKRMEYKHS